jgi:hypothetical protein
MRLLFIFVLAFGLVGAAAATASAQCDRNTLTPIRCGYYDEGYQDGARDAQTNQSNNYQRYRSKYERQYESFYRDGYSAGYASVPGYSRWTAAQRSAYDIGYGFGVSDRQSMRSNSPQQHQSRTAVAVRPYLFQGYSDGYLGIPRRYDFPIGQPGTGGPGFPPGQGTATGSATWGGRVDNRANIILRGNSLTAVDLTNSGLTTTQQFVNGSLPRRESNVTVRKLNGRGTVTVIQQPSRFNNFEAIVQISDPRSGADNYRIEINWQASSIIENYQSGRVNWRGRVDQTVNIYVSGADVWEQVVSGNALMNTGFDINGYLARRPGTVNVRKRNGRGTVSVLQQPSAANDYIAVIQVFDPQGGADNYEVEITW